VKPDNVDVAATDGAPAGSDIRAQEFRVSERDDAGVRVIAIRGELDLSTAPPLCLRLEAVRRRPRARVVVDLSDLVFCDSTGLRALILAGQEITAAAGVFAVVVPPGDGAVARMFLVCGAAELLQVFPTVEQAVAAVWNGRHGDDAPPPKEAGGGGAGVTTA